MKLRAQSMSRWRGGVRNGVSQGTWTEFWVTTDEPGAEWLKVDVLGKHPSSRKASALRYAQAWFDAERLGAQRFLRELPHRDQRGCRVANVRVQPAFKEKLKGVALPK